MMSDMEMQLQKLLTAENVAPPALCAWQLEQMTEKREQRRLLLAVSVLSFCWSTLCLILAALLLTQQLALGSSLLCALLLGWLSAGLLAAALLKTEQRRTSHLLEL